MTSATSCRMLLRLTSIILTEMNAVISTCELNVRGELGFMVKEVGGGWGEGIYRRA